MSPNVYILASRGLDKSREVDEFHHTILQTTAPEWVTIKTAAISELSASEALFSGQLIFGSESLCSCACPRIRVLLGETSRAVTCSITLTCCAYYFNQKVFRKTEEDWTQRKSTPLCSILYCRHTLVLRLLLIFFLPRPLSAILSRLSWCAWNTQEFRGVQTASFDSERSSCCRNLQYYLFFL